MTISKRQLTKWRKDALIEIRALKGWESTNEFTIERRISAERILLLTQELLDQHILSHLKEAK